MKKIASIILAMILGGATLVFAARRNPKFWLLPAALAGCTITTGRLSPKS